MAKNTKTKKHNSAAKVEESGALVYKMEPDKKVHFNEPSANTMVLDYLYGARSNSNVAIKELSEETHLPIKLLAEDIFEITPKTFNSYRLIGKNVPMHVRELSIKLKVLYEKGVELFGNIDKFNEWIFKPSYGLGGTKPFDFLNTITGIEMVSDELSSIEFGTTA